MNYQQPPVYHYGPRYDGCLKFILYILSFLIPIVGIVAGVIYMSKGDPESSALGRTCLILGIVSIVIGCCVGVGFGVLPILMESMGAGGY